MKGYKVFNSNWTCRGFQYEVGKTYEHSGDIEPCNKGFHFCEKAIDCFNYYSFDSNNKVAEIEAIGKVKTDGNKSVTDKIKIVREITWYELLDMVNIGKGNTGNRNSGDYNSGNRNSGFFCSSTPTVTFFNKPTNLTFDEAYDLEGIKTIRNRYHNNIRVSSDDMSDSEKKEHPEHKTLGGYLKTLSYKAAWEEMWERLSDAEKQSVYDLPNFDKDIFFEITGIRVE